MRIEWDRYRVQLHRLGRVVWPRGIAADQAWMPHFNTPDYVLLVTTHGRARVRLERGWTEVRPGHCLWLRPGRKYRAEQDRNDPWGHDFPHFDLVDARGRKRPADDPLPPELIEPPDALAAQAATRRIVDLCFGFRPGGYREPPYPEPFGRIAALTLQVLLMELDAATSLVTQTRLPAYQERRIRESAIEIAANPTAAHSVADLARRAGYSVSRYSQLFRLLTGQTPELFAVHARLHHAEQLLRETDLTVSAVAEQAGYRGIYFFSRQFKRFHGQSPLKYRRLKLGKKE